MGTKTDKHLSWHSTPDVALARRETTRAAFLIQWVKELHRRAPDNPRASAILSIVSRYHRRAAEGLERMRQSSRSLAAHQEALREAGLPERRRFRLRKTESSARFARQIAAARAARKDLVDITALWMDLTVQYDEVSALVQLFDQDLLHQQTASIATSQAAPQPAPIKEVPVAKRDPEVAAERPTSSASTSAATLASPPVRRVLAG